jgi:hypothetical protein
MIPQQRVRQPESSAMDSPVAVDKSLKVDKPEPASREHIPLHHGRYQPIRMAFKGICQ